MPESLRLYLDQMLQTRVAQVLRQAGYDVLRASETGQSRADDQVLGQLPIIFFPPSTFPPCHSTLRRYRQASPSPTF